MGLGTAPICADCRQPLVSFAKSPLAIAATGASLIRGARRACFETLAEYCAGLSQT